VTGIHTYKDTLEMAILIVKSEENVTKTKFSLLPSFVGLKYPRRMSAKHPMPVVPV
jgi:hypothetical protein